MSLPGTRVTHALTIAFALLGPSAAHAQAIKTELPDSLVKQATVPEGTARVCQAIQSGKARQVLDRLILC